MTRPLTNSLRLTKTSVTQAVHYDTGAKYSRYWDTDMQGLGLRVYASGKKSFVLRYRINGVEKTIVLGRFGAITVEDARKLAAQHHGGLHQVKPVDPLEVKAQARRGETFADAFAYYLEHHAKANKRSWATDERLYESHLRGPLGRRKLADVSRRDVAQVHADLTTSGRKVLANRVLALASSVFGRMIRSGLFDGANPCQGVARNAEQERERYLSNDELQRMQTALTHEPNTDIRDFVWVALLTGQRRSNVLGMEWSELSLNDPDNATWTVPTSKAKAKKPITVPLSPDAAAILSARRELVAASPNGAKFVFPSHGKTGHMVEPKSAWRRVCKAAGIEGVRIHDLRHTLASWAAQNNVSLPIIGKMLGHNSVKTTARYSHMLTDTVRSHMEPVTNLMRNAANGSAADVIPIDRGKRKAANE